MVVLGIEFIMPPFLKLNNNKQTFKLPPATDSRGDIFRIENPMECLANPIVQPNFSYEKYG
jgi:hypothetical protein